MRRTLLALACLAPLAAAAQERPVLRLIQPDPTRTMLQLSESAEIAVKQDELHAVLVAEARGGSPAAVQAAVNRAMSAALDKARAAPSVAAETGGYSVWRSYGASLPASQAWQGSQTLALTARDPAPLLELVGALQAQGLAVRGLAFRVSPELLRRAREQASEQAVRGLQARAERIAGLLGLAFERFASVTLEAEPGPAMPMAAVAAMQGGAGGAPPVAEAALVRVGARVSAEAVLQPRQ